MIIKQLSVFLENKSGRLTEVTEALASAQINISAFSIADTSDFGVLRMIVNKPDEADENIERKRRVCSYYRSYRICSSA